MIPILSPFHGKCEIDSKPGGEFAAPEPHRAARALPGLLLALLASVLSLTAVANALPSILTDLDGTPGQFAWVVTAALLAATATTPIWGKLADLFSKKLLYQLAIVLFTAGSALAGAARSMDELITLRALQGIGIGGLQALVQVVLGALIPPRDRGRYAGYLSATAAAGTVSGPLIGGLVVDSPLGWRWCFWGCVPIAALAFLVLGRTLRLPIARREVKIDWLGAVLLVGGATLSLVWVSLAGKRFGWLSWPSACHLGGAAVALALAVLVERKAREPVVPLRLFRERTFALSVLGSFTVGTAMLAGAVFLGPYLQIARGFSPTRTGLMTAPLVAGTVLSSTLAGRVIARTGKAKPWLVGGTVVLLAGLGLLSTIDHTTDLAWVGLFLGLTGLGLGGLTQNLVLVAQNTVGMADLGTATSAIPFFRHLGGSAGISVLGTVLAGHLAEAGTSLPAAYGDAIGLLFLITCCITVVTLVSMLLIKETPLRTERS
ncbi:MFS transporter [Amycolatopsis anabasis]|uniref:MFS transporter n=1 Tax=Amycolatopsis anabasis TaxID=1840409 RepID=UPI0031B59AAC